MARETWEVLLLFLLQINDTLLAAPTVQGIHSSFPPIYCLQCLTLYDMCSQEVLAPLFLPQTLACSHKTNEVEEESLLLKFLTWISMK